MYKFTLFAFLLFALISCETDESDNVVADFTYNYHGVSYEGFDSVAFINKSKNATDYLWDFGDGSGSTNENPIHNFEMNYPLVVKLTATNTKSTDVLIDTIYGWAVVYKPNIYIYPEETTSLCVNVNFPKSGEMIASIPEYVDGWCVTVEPSGEINGQYDFLFYESTQPNIWHTQKGWCIAQENLESFFNDILGDYNLSEAEIHDFNEYWLAELDNSPYYLIYPQLKNTIDRVITLDFSIQPENIFRLFFAFKPCNNLQTITEPQIIPANRNGFNVVEWGGIIL